MEPPDELDNLRKDCDCISVAGVVSRMIMIAGTSLLNKDIETG